MFMNNFSTLLKGADADVASIEARKNMLKSMINSEAQDSGWGTLEVFLVKLCSLFSKRCKNVSATLTDIQHAINGFKDNYRPATGQDLSVAGQSVFKLWLAAGIYRKLGADMHFQVNIDADSLDSAKMILSGQPDSQSIWTEAELRCEIDITVAEAEIFKALAGDILPEQGDSINNPYAQSDLAKGIIQRCLPKELTEPQTTLANTLIGLPVNSSLPSMKLINRANDALKNVSEYIKNNNIVGSDSGVTLDSATFHNMYAKTTRYTMEDFLTVSFPVITATEMIIRKITVEQTVKFVKQRISTFDTAEKNASERIKLLISDEVVQLKKQAFGLAEGLYAAMTGNEAKFDKDDGESSLNHLPKAFQKSFKKFISDCNECTSNPSQDSFDAAVSSLTKLLDSDVKIYSSELNGKERYREKLREQIIKFTAFVNDKDQEKNRMHKQLERLEEQQNTLVQNIKGKDELVQNIDSSINRLNNEVGNLNSNKEKVNSELNELNNQALDLQQQLTSCQQSRQEVLDACCSELKQLQEKINLQRQQSTGIEADCNEQIGLSNRVLAKAKNSSFAKYAVQLITTKEHNLDDMTNASEIHAYIMCEVINLLNRRFFSNYTLHEFDSIIQANNLLEIEDCTSGQANFIKAKKLSPRIRRINEESLKTFLKKLDEEEIKRKCNECKEESQTRGHHFIFSKNSKSKQLQEKMQTEFNQSFNERFKVVKNILNGYKDSYNALFSIMFNRSVMLKRKQDYVTVLFNTVKSMNNIKDQLDNSLIDLDRTLDSDKVSFFDSMPEEVKTITQNIKEMYQSVVEKLVSKKEEFQSRTERLLNSVLPKLITSDGKYLFDYNNFEGSNPLSEQDIEDIQWCVQYIEDAGFSDIAKHQETNVIFSYTTFLREKKQCQQELEILKSSMEELGKKYKDNFDEFQEKITKFNESIAENSLQQQMILNYINQMTATIQEKSIEINEQIKKKDDLQKEILTYQSEVNKAKTAIAKIKGDITKVNKLIKSKTRDSFSAEKKLETLNEDINVIKQLMQKTQQISQNFNDKSVQSISAGLKQRIEPLDYQVKDSQRSKEFLEAAVALVNNKGVYNLWIETGQFIEPKDKKDYNGMIFDVKIPYTADKEESIKIWDACGYRTLNIKNDRTKVRTDEKVAKDAIAVDEANQLLEKVQMECFEELFAIEGNQLIDDVHNLLKDYVGKEEKPDFKSFSKYIEFCHSAIKSYEKSQQSRGVVTIDSVMQQSIKEFKEKLYKAQVLFGIYIAKVYLNKDFQMFRNKEGFSADILRADIESHEFSQVYNVAYDVERQFSEPFNEWKAKNKDDENKKMSLLDKMRQWMNANASQRDDNPVVQYLNDVLKNQIFLISSAAKTGRVITPEISSDFVAPSLQYVLKVGPHTGREGIDFLFSLTDAASGVLVMDYQKGTSEPSITYKSVFGDREKWIIQNAADFNQQVAQICGKIGLNVKGVTTPGESSAVA